jgi:ribosomal protein S18 acetylase RimI-like enzyme
MVKIVEASAREKQKILNESESLDMLKHFNDPKQWKFLVLKDGERVVGRLVYSKQGNNGKILDLMIYPGYERNGYARKLISKVKKDFREPGATLKVLSVQDARKLYEKSGMKPGEMEGYSHIWKRKARRTQTKTQKNRTTAPQNVLRKDSMLKRRGKRR